MTEKTAAVQSAASNRSYQMVGVTLVQEPFRNEFARLQQLEGLSADELLAALSPETRAALAQRLKDYGSQPDPAVEETEHGEGKQ